MKTLVVDDDEDMLEVISQYLSLKGFEIVGRAKNGKMGFEIYQRQKPELVITDIMMPDYDGLYLIGKIRQVSPNANIIAVTGDIRDSTRIKLSEENVHILFKPFEIKKFLKICTSIKENYVKTN